MKMTGRKMVGPEGGGDGGGDRDWGPPILRKWPATKVKAKNVFNPKSY